MKTKLKIHTTLWITLLSITLLSCNQWLDVKPNSQVKDTELFSTETGFKEALAGVYSALTYESLYGKEMTFGLMGVLAYEWDYAATSYDSDKTYAYKSNTNSLNRIDAIWKNQYNAISNGNKILENIDDKKSVFNDINYKIIKGEALALRAFIHFDLLRVFGASFEEDPAKIAIPYVTESSQKNFPQLKVTDVIDLVLADLLAAEELLKEDPILTGKIITTSDDNGYLMNRQVHLNYFAVKGMLARVYLYKKDYPKALENAQVVIASTKFPWINSANLINKDAADLTFSTEHLFALNVVRLGAIAQNSFSSTGNSTFHITQASLLDYYNSATQDYRYLYLFNVNDQGNYYLNKFIQLPSSNWPQAYRNKLPLLKLSEMYFIAAESLKTTNYTQSVEYINQVRVNRGLQSTPIDIDDFENVLAQEYRKEFIGEGQLFFYHKRKNEARIPKATGLNLVQLKGYKLPLPLSEMENGVGRIDNQ